MIPKSTFFFCRCMAFALFAHIAVGIGVAVAVAPVAPTDAAGTQDQVFRILAPTIADPNVISLGTGTIFDFAIQEIRNKTYCRICLATADHVLDKTNTKSIELGFRNENPVGTFGPNGFNFQPLQTVVGRGAKGIPTANGWAGGGVDKPDIGFIGATIDLSNVGGNPPSGPGFLDATKAVLLVSAAGDAVPLAAIAPNVFPQFTFHGYGNSGRAPTAAEIANVGGAADYAYLRHNNADDEGYGILRPLSETITILEYENAQNGSLAGAPYKVSVTSVL